MAETTGYLLKPETFRALERLLDPTRRRQRPRTRGEKRRRYPPAEAAGGGALIPAMLTGDVPAANNDGLTKTSTPGISQLQVATLQQWDNDLLKLVPRRTEEGEIIQRYALNRSETTINASETLPIGVEGYELETEGVTYYVVVNVMDFRSVPGYSSADRQALYHPQNGQFRLGGSPCPAP